MGTLTYGIPSVIVEFDDRLLAHLRAVIVTKLRRSESFLFTWTHHGGEAEASLWIHPSIAMQFDLITGDDTKLNKQWLDALVERANSPGGLRIVPEPGAEGTTVKADSARPVTSLSKLG